MKQMKESNKSATAFSKTRKMFEAACGFENVRPNTAHAEWMALDSDLHAAALYCIFYHQIYLARVKTYAEYVSDEDAVSEIMAKLLAVTPKIEADANLYKPAYIYTVIFNALLQPTRIKKNEWNYNGKLTSEKMNDLELDPYLSIIDPHSDPLGEVESKDFSDLIDSLPDELKDAIDGLMTRSAVGRSRSDRKEIIAELRRIFSDFHDGEEEPMTFSKVYSQDDEVECADVLMPDGEIAQYLGESYMKNGSLRIRFFGAYRDYDYLYKKAQHFKVVNVSCY